LKYIETRIKQTINKLRLAADLAILSLNNRFKHKRLPKTQAKIALLMYEAITATTATNIK